MVVLPVPHHDPDYGTSLININTTAEDKNFSTFLEECKEILSMGGITR